METSRRKKFCVSRRVEEYQYIESGSEEEQNSEEDFASICKILHQKALKRSKQLEVEQKFKNEFQLRDASFARLRHINNQTSISSDNYSNSHTNLTNIQKTLNTTTPKNNSKGKINKTSIKEISNGYNNGYSSASSVISFSKAIIDEPEDIYLNHDSQNNVIKLDEYKLNEFIPSFEPKRPSISGKSIPNNSWNSLSFYPTEKNDKRSTIIPRNESPKKSSISGRKSFTVKNSEIVSDVPNSKTDSDFSNLRSSRSKNLNNLSNASSKHQSKLDNFSKKSPSKSQSLNQPSKKSSRLNSEILTNQLETSSSLKNNSTRKSRKSSSIGSPTVRKNNSAINTILNDEEDQLNESILNQKRRISSRLSIGRNSSTPKSSKVISLEDDETGQDKDLKHTNKSEIKSFEYSRSKQNTSINSTSLKASTINALPMNGNLINKSAIDTTDNDEDDSSLVFAKKSMSKRNSSIRSVKEQPNIDEINKNNNEKYPSLLNNKSTNKSIRNSNIKSTRLNKSRIENNESDQEDDKSSDQEQVVKDESNQESIDLPPLNDSEIKSIASSRQKTSRSTVNSLSFNGNLVNKSAIDTIENGESDSSPLNVADKIKDKSLKNSFIKSEILSDIDEDVEEDEIENDKESFSTSNNNSMSKNLRNSINLSQKLSEEKLEESDEEQAKLLINKSEIESIEPSTSKQDLSTGSTKNNSMLNKDQVNYSAINTIEGEGITSVSEIKTKEIEVNKESSDLPPLNNSEIQTYYPSKEETSTESSGSSLEIDENLVNKSEINTMEYDENNSITSEVESKNSSEESTSHSNVEKPEEEKESQLDITNDNESKSELKNCSFSRIESNFSNVDISLEPANNSIENHLESQNVNESVVNNVEENNKESSSSEEQKKDNDFKIPKLPLNKKQFMQKNQPILKKQPKYYETMVNKTPTIIYPDREQQQDEEDDDQDGLVRRSNRIRVRPLEYWRNQKLKYKLDTATKCFTIEGVEKGFKPENPFSKKHAKDTQEQQKDSNKRKLRQSKKKSKLLKIKKENQSSTEEEEEDDANETSSSSEDEEIKPIKKERRAPNEESIHVDVNESALMVSERIKREAVEFYSKSDLVWNPSRAASGVFIALMNRKKSAKTGIQASGFIKLEPFAEKPRQTSSDYVTKYVVMFGAVSVQVGDKPTVFLKNMESFVVEKNTMYSIRNLRKDEALLYFDVTRSK